MKTQYREVVFQDTTTGKKFLTRSTAQTTDTIEYLGKTYPLVKVDVSSDSHPAYTGRAAKPSATGRVEAFRKKYGK